jgi:hypothetical protein
MLLMHHLLHFRNINSQLQRNLVLKEEVVEAGVKVASVEEEGEIDHHLIPVRLVLVLILVHHVTELIIIVNDVVNAQLVLDHLSYSPSS